MTARSLVEARIAEILRDRLNVNPALLADLTPRTPLLDGALGLDSVEAFNLACALEEAFGIEIAAEDFTVDLFRDLATLADYVLRQAGARPASEDPPPAP